MSDPLNVKCPACGEAPRKPCRDYGTIPFRATRFERHKADMRHKSQIVPPHASRVALAQRYG